MKVYKKTDISFQTSGEFLNWWFERKVLDGKALQIFERYYTNYRDDFDGYLSQAWTNRHLELDRELRALNPTMTFISNHNASFLNLFV